MSKKKLTNSGIKNWPEDDRPREKLLKYGEQSLSNTELLAILIRTGIPNKGAFDISRELLQKLETLRTINTIEISELRKINGLNDAKICQIKASLELGKRLMSEEKKVYGTIKSSKQLAEVLIPLMRDLTNEVFKIVLLNKRNQVTNIIEVAKGTIDRVSPSIREILQITLSNHVPAILLAHNHPSGDVLPSEADKILTRNLIIAACSMELRVFDHLIIGENKYYSFSDEGLIEKYEMQMVSNFEL
ncbi:MAG: DNA repair protein RadC [Methanolobus sp.]|nr:DNA repair protein RadC [Methanolobus sp.]